jgi:hypothetical protein
VSVSLLFRDEKRLKNQGGTAAMRIARRRPELIGRGAFLLPNLLQ